MSVARHPILVASDSDVIVDPELPAARALHRLRTDSGLVTLYRAQAVGGVWSHLVALFINEWFMPAVRIARLFGSASFTSVSRLRCDARHSNNAGGSEAIVNVLADDYWLGEHTRRLRAEDRRSRRHRRYGRCRRRASARLAATSCAGSRTIRSVDPRSYGPSASASPYLSLRRNIRSLAPVRSFWASRWRPGWPEYFCIVWRGRPAHRRGWCRSAIYSPSRCGAGALSRACAGAPGMYAPSSA